MTIKHRVELEIAKHCKGGLCRVYELKRKCGTFCSILAFIAMLFTPVSIIFLAEVLK